MKKVLFTFGYNENRIQKVEALGYEVICIRDKEVSYSDRLKDVEVLICYNPFSTLDINKMKKLKWIQLSSIGIDQLPKDIVLKNNIIITNNKGGYRIPIGEWIIMDILNLLKKTTYFYKNQMQKKWKLTTNISELYGKTIGFIGTGAIAVEAAKRLKSFEAYILGVNTSGRTANYFDMCYPLEKIDSVLSQSDIVVLTLPYTKETHQLINEDRFAAMKDNVLLVNIARGTIVDEESLIKNLHNGKIAAAALDVFVEEPLPSSSPLWEMDNVIITPHNSWASDSGDERLFKMIFENLKRYANDDQLINTVDIVKGY